MSKPHSGYMLSELKNPNRRHDRQFFYKYVTASTAKAILGSNKLRWSSPLIFNDPFDTPRKLTFDCSPRELQEALIAQVALLIESGAETPANAPAILRTLMNRSRQNGVGAGAVIDDLRTKALVELPEPAFGFHEFQQHWDKWMPAMRVLCISEVATSTAMWTHYADSHRGVVLEFEAADAVDSPLLVARPVRYQDEPPRVPSKEEWVESLIGRKKIDIAELLSEYQYMKSTQWAPEKEWRVVSCARSDETGLFTDFRFSREELRRVIFGASCSSNDVAEIGAMLAKYPRSTVARASINHELRRIEF